MVSNPDPRDAFEQSPLSVPSVDAVVPPNPQTKGTRADPSKVRRAESGVTRAGLVWVAVVVGLILLVVMIIFILQNQQPVRVFFLGLDGTIALGMALLVAAVAGGLFVAAAGVARVVQLRVRAYRTRHGS